MPAYTIQAEYDRLEAVRLHTPGIELLSGGLDPTVNLFLDNVPPEQARREHQTIVQALEDYGIDVHQLADDLAQAGVLDGMVREAVTVEDEAGDPDDAGLERVIELFEPWEKLGLVLGRVTLTTHDVSGSDRTRWGRTAESPVSSVKLERPISNMYYQCDTTIVGDKGPILCNMFEAVRQPEVPYVRAAWEGVGADIVHQVEGEPIEGGEFIPADDFALLGVSAEIDGEEELIRTSYAAGEQLLEENAFSYDEVGLVRAPLSIDRKLATEHDTFERTMHLLGWMNIPADGLAVVYERLAEESTVDVYSYDGGGYRKDRSVPFLEYLDEQGYATIAATWEERWPANFLTLDDGVVMPVYEPTADGEYVPTNNPTIEALKDHGVEIVPDGTGLAPETLIRGAGGIRCMSMPMRRS
ncbi:MAG: arginine deiminase family protein [Halobacteriales archaeon]|nr:arginine deiminase family protein [Halobacteriales archaeon]